MTQVTAIELSDVQIAITDLGYDTEVLNETTLIITTDTNTKIIAILNDDVIVFSVKLMDYNGTVAQFIAQNPQTVENILIGSDGVNAKFILSENEGKTAINLVEKAKLQEIGADDIDDIKFALASLEQDAVFDSRQALQGLFT